MSGQVIEATLEVAMTYAPVADNIHRPPAKDKTRCPSAHRHVAPRPP